MRAVPFTRVPVVELWTAKRMLDIGDCASLQLQLASLCSQVRLVSSSRSLQRLSSPKQYVQLLCAARNMLSIRVGAHISLALGFAPLNNVAEQALFCDVQLVALDNRQQTRRRQIEERCNSEKQTRSSPEPSKDQAAHRGFESHRLRSFR